MWVGRGAGGEAARSVQTGPWQVWDAWGSKWGRGRAPLGPPQNLTKGPV